MARLGESMLCQLIFACSTRGQSFFSFKGAVYPLPMCDGCQGELILELFDAQKFHKCQSIEYHNRTTCCKNKEKGLKGKDYMGDQNITLCDA